MGMFQNIMERCAGCARVVKRSTENPTGLTKGKIVVSFCVACEKKNEERRQLILRKSG
jgi:hypothetical protein